MNEQIEVLKTAADYIDNLKSGIKFTIKSFLEENESQAYSTISLIADGIDWLDNVIKLTYDTHKGKISLVDINEKLKEIVEALEHEDCVLMSDLFEYEIMPVLEDVQVEIRKIIA